MIPQLDQLYRRSRLHQWTARIAGSQGGPGVDSEQFHDLRQVALYLLVRRLRPNLVVETGVQHGRSSLAILRALHENGHGGLTSIDVPRLEIGQFNEDGRWDDAHVDRWGDTGREVPAYLRARWHLMLEQHPADAHGLLRGIAANIVPIDLFVHDSEHSYATMMEEFTTAWPAIAPGGVLYADDIDWNGAFRDFASLHALPRHEFALARGGGRIGALVKWG